MHGKILKSGKGYVLRYKSNDVAELRRMAGAILSQFSIDYTEGA